MANLCEIGVQLDCPRKTTEEGENQERDIHSVVGLLLGNGRLSVQTQCVPPSVPSSPPFVQLILGPRVNARTTSPKENRETEYFPSPIRQMVDNRYHSWYVFFFELVLDSMQYSVYVVVWAS